MAARRRGGSGWSQWLITALLPMILGMLALYYWGFRTIRVAERGSSRRQDGIAAASESLSQNLASVEDVSPQELNFVEPLELPGAPELPAAPEAVEVEEPAMPAEAPPLEASAKYGFYLHVYADPAAVIYQVRHVKKHFPDSPIYIMSDGGLDFSALCKQEGCTFVLCPPANDRWHPWPFFRRLYDAAVSLKAEYVIMLEPDNTIHGYIKRPPTADAGGLFVDGRSFGQGKYVERLARERVPGFKWSKKSMSSGLCGGAYFRTEAILDAFSDETMMKLDWNYLGDRGSKEIFSSDFAMQYALAARGWTIAPWAESAQMDKDKDIPLTGAKDSSFRHYCACYPGGKPTYNLKVEKKDSKLFKSSKYDQTGGPYSPAVCQLCYNYSRYVQLWGSDRCTNSVPFHFSEKLISRYHADLKNKPCDLPWLCEPGKIRQPGIDPAEPTALPVDPQAVFVELGDDANVCPEGTAALQDVSWCAAAAEKLGRKLAYDNELYQESDPTGCVFRVPDNDLYFNAAEEGKRNGGRRLICRQVA